MQTKQLKYLTVAAASVLIVSVAYAADKPADSTKEPSGATFAHTCAACHGTYGYSNDSAFPGLAGMDHQVFVREMKRFRSKDRPSSITLPTVTTMPNSSAWPRSLPLYQRNLRASPHPNNRAKGRHRDV